MKISRREAIGVVTAGVTAPALAAGGELSAAAGRVAERVLRENKSYDRLFNPLTTHAYALDIACEGLLELARLENRPAWRAHVIGVAERRGIVPGATVAYPGQPLACLTYALYENTGDRRWLAGFVQESARWRKEAERTAEGAVLYRSRAQAGMRALLIDAIQEYGARMARAGAVAKDGSFVRECVEQFRVHRALLRNPATGLWSQGRGWIPERPSEISPGAWSRGHGWLLRGLTAALAATPRRSQAFEELRRCYRELADALLPLQEPGGMWRTLLHLPAAESPVDASGTGMMATAFSRAWREGLVADARLRDSAVRAFRALPAFVDADGKVLSVSPGPGPLAKEAPYRVQKFPAGDAHGTFAILLAAAESIRLERKSRG